MTEFVVGLDDRLPILAGITLNNAPEAIIGFIIGFLVNLAAMRSMFVTAKACDQRNAACNIHIQSQLETMREEIAQLQKNQMQHYGLLCAVAARLGVKDNG